MAGAGRGNSQTRPTGQCGYCGFALPPSARFCGGCGRPRTAPTAFAVHALSFLQSQIQPALADRIIQSGTSMLGERKHVTVLFADIQQSTELIDKLDPEDALEVIGPILRCLMDAVHEHDGLVNQTRGDGIMALFGAPIASEDHAVQACRAALAARKAVLDFNRTNQRAIGLRIGLNSGQVIIHSIGNNLSMNYDAVGKTVHLAARMEELAAADSIKLSSYTFQLAKGFISALPLGSEAAKGIGELIETYELVAMRPRTRWQARLSGGLSPLIGRDDELAHLKDALAKAGDGEGRAICITGPAGIGKSRLVHEFISGIASEWLVVQTACAPQRTNSTYYPVSNLIRELFRIGAAESAASAASRVQTQLVHFDASLAPHLPAILSLLDLNSPDGTWKDLEPLERRNKVIEAIKALIFSQVRLTPLLILIEDIHWIDAETLLILNSVTAALGSTRIVIIATQRPEHIWAAESVDRLDLSALDSANGDQLLSSLLGNDRSLEPLRQRVLAQAEGNPLFVEELARTLKDTKVLVGGSGQYRVSSASPGIDIPETIHSVLAARIDRLDSSGKSLLQMSAVIGPELSLTLLADMAGVQPDDLRARLAPLQAADFIRDVGTPESADYAFKHELAREVAYGMMLLSVRRYLHAKATEIIERRFGDRLDEHIDRLADHAFLAELWQKAYPYQLRSCRRAIKRGANRAAIAIYERGRETLSHWQPSQKKTIAEIDLHLTVVTALEPLGMHRRIAEVLREARHLAEQSQEPWRVAAVNCQLTVALWRLGHHTEAMAAARTAEAIAEQVRQPVLTFAALHNLGIIYHETGDFRTALDIHERCLAIETPEIDEKRAGWAALPSVMLRTFMTDSLIDLGDFPRAELLAEDARNRAIAANHAYSLANINHVLSRLRIAQSRPNDALTLLNESWQTCLDLEMKQMYPIFASRIGEAYLLLNDIDTALRILAVPEELDIPLADHAFGWRFLFIAQGYAFLAAGRHEEAASVAARALELAKERCELPQQAYASKLLGDVARSGAESSHAGSSRDASESYYRQAMDLAERCGMQPFALRCQDALAALVV